MIFFQCSIEFHFTHSHQKCNVGTPLMKMVFWYLIRSTTLQKSNILYFCELAVAISLMMSSPRGFKTHGIITLTQYTALHVERGGYRYLVRKHH